MKGQWEPYFMLQHKKEFWRRDRLSLKEKVWKTLNSHEMKQQAKDISIERLGHNAYFGCNGHGEVKDDKESMNIVCFFERFWGILEYRIQHLGGNAYFGCNGHGEEKDDKEFMKIVCFFERRRYIPSPDGTGTLILN
ncbi:hypothetical protein GCK32_004692 [Trichostrongylus colubriformis]|uniref:Uncharacterized protein n=1 Tax=Trichostrongylus colubriformis TaxID=6319 RepID=A0AAN8FCI2_TRICO